MPETGINNRGVALFIVLITIFLITILTNVLMNTMLSHTRLTRHQTGRIQAYYAAWGGLNYAREMLRLGTAAGGWEFIPGGNNSCQSPNGCLTPVDNALPASIQNRRIRIIFCPSGATPANCAGSTTTCNPPPGINFCINSVATYTSPSP